LIEAEKQTIKKFDKHTLEKILQIVFFIAVTALQK